VVEEILELIDDAERGQLGAEVVPEGNARAPVVELEEGVSTRSYWKWRLVDIENVGYKWLTTNDRAIDSYVRKKHKGAEGVIGGIEVYRTKGLAVRKAKVLRLIRERSER
jgi:hypothetical protein